MIESVVRFERKKMVSFTQSDTSFYMLLSFQVFCLFKNPTMPYKAYRLRIFFNIDVITVSKKEQKSSDAPAMIYVVTENNIKNRGYRNLQDLLEDIPEIEIQKKSTSEFSNYFTFRGIFKLLHQARGSEVCCFGHRCMGNW